MSPTQAEMRRAGCISLAAAMFFLSGCGSDGRMPTSPVTGTVIIGDKPIGGADITFHPADDEKPGRPAFGKTNDAGEFSLSTYDDDDGAVPGEYLISVVKQVIRPEVDVKAMTPMGSSSSGAGLDMYKKMMIGNKREKPTVDDGAVPAKYNDPKKSGLKRTVEASGGNVFNLKLDNSDSK